MESSQNLFNDLEPVEYNGTNKEKGVVPGQPMEEETL